MSVRLTSSLFPQAPTPQPEPERAAVLDGQIMDNLTQLPELLKEWRGLYIQEALQMEERAFIREDDISRLDKENRANQEQIRLLLETITKLEEENTALKAESHKHANKATRIEAQRTMYAERAKRYGEEVEKLKAKVRDYAEKLESLEVENLGLTNDFKEYVKVITDFGEANEAHEQKIAWLEDRIRFYEENAAPFLDAADADGDDEESAGAARRVRASDAPMEPTQQKPKHKGKNKGKGKGKGKRKRRAASSTDVEDAQSEEEEIVESAQEKSWWMQYWRMEIGHFKDKMELLGDPTRIPRTWGVPADKLSAWCRFRVQVLKNSVAHREKHLREMEQCY